MKRSWWVWGVLSKAALASPSWSRISRYLTARRDSSSVGWRGRTDSGSCCSGSGSGGGDCSCGIHCLCDSGYADNGMAACCTRACRVLPFTRAFLVAEACAAGAVCRLPGLGEAPASPLLVPSTIAMASDSRSSPCGHPSAVRGHPSAVRGRPSAVRGRPSAVRGRFSAVRGRFSAVAAALNCSGGGESLCSASDPLALSSAKHHCAMPLACEVQGPALLSLANPTCPVNSAGAVKGAWCLECRAIVVQGAKGHL